MLYRDMRVVIPPVTPSFKNSAPGTKPSHPPKSFMPGSWSTQSSDSLPDSSWMPPPRDESNIAGPSRLKGPSSNQSNVKRFENHPPANSAFYDGYASSGSIQDVSVSATKASAFGHQAFSGSLSSNKLYGSKPAVHHTSKSSRKRSFKGKGKASEPLNSTGITHRDHGLPTLPDVDLYLPPCVVCQFFIVQIFC